MIAHGAAVLVVVHVRLVRVVRDEVHFTAELEGARGGERGGERRLAGWRLERRRRRGDPDQHMRASVVVVIAACAVERSAQSSSRFLQW